MKVRDWTVTAAPVLEANQPMLVCVSKVWGKGCVVWGIAAKEYFSWKGEVGRSAEVIQSSIIRKVVVHP